MPSTDINQLNQAVKTFQALEIDQQLATLGLLYLEIEAAITAAMSEMTLPQEVRQLLHQAKHLRSQDQLQFIRDVFSDQKTDQDAIALDIHPTQAMLELTPGAVTPALSQYRALSPEARLLFWYQMGQDMGEDVIQLPMDCPLCPRAQELLNTVKSMSFQQQVDFCRQVV